MRLLIHNGRTVTPAHQRPITSPAAIPDPSKNVWRMLAHGRTPGIQVVISAWNCEVWLQRCLDSVEDALRGRKWALILADDGSDDHTWDVMHNHVSGAEAKIVERFAKAPNVSIAKNRAVALGKTLRTSHPVMCLMDADDVMRPERINRLLSAALESGAPVVVGSWERVREGKRTRVAPQTWMFGPPVTLFHAALIPWNDELFPADFERHGDLALWSLWRANGVPIHFVPDALVHEHHYRLGSVSNPADIADVAPKRQKLTDWQESIRTQPLLSFCTSCMGRLPHLKQTLLHNLQITGDREDVEFCLVNYNSRDGLDEWVQQNLRAHLESGRVKYLWTKRPQEFCHSHAKNVAHHLATGRYLVNLDADNFLTPEYLRDLRSAIGRGAEVVHVPSVKSAWGGGYGRVVVKRDLFYHLGGYDEIHWGWGAEDKDLSCRAAALGRLELLNPATLQFIEHDDEERTAHLRTKDKHATNAQWQTYFEGKLRNGQLIANEGREWGQP